MAVCRQPYFANSFGVHHAAFRQFAVRMAQKRRAVLLAVLVGDFGHAAIGPALNLRTASLVVHVGDFDYAAIIGIAKSVNPGSGSQAGGALAGSGIEFNELWVGISNVAIRRTVEFQPAGLVRSIRAERTGRQQPP